MQEAQRAHRGGLNAAASHSQRQQQLSLGWLNYLEGISCKKRRFRAKFGGKRIRQGCSAQAYPAQPPFQPVQRPNISQEHSSRLLAPANQQSAQQ